MHAPEAGSSTAARLKLDRFGTKFFKCTVDLVGCGIYVVRWCHYNAPRKIKKRYFLFLKLKKVL
jgi:hypothetical protein